MKSAFKFISLLALLVCMPVSVSLAEDKHHFEHGESSKGVESLSPEIRELLSKEMKEIQKGMMSIIPAYASGKWEVIAEIGSSIEHSYILKKNITKSQIEELHSSLPAEFIELDKQFHYMAGMLSHVAKNRKPELVGFYFSKMIELCVSCHSKFATHKFTSFQQKSVSAEKHHH